jgi:hypothetical protein
MIEVVVLLGAALASGTPSLARAASQLTKRPARSAQASYQTGSSTSSPTNVGC